MRISILLAAVVVFGASTASAQPTATSVMQDVDTFYQGIHQCTSSFSQTVTNATFGKTTTSKGKLRLKRGKMRWDYTAKAHNKGKVYVADGKTLWVVEHDNRQIIKKSLKKSVMPAAVSFLFGKGGLAKAFTAKLLSSGPSTVQLELTPIQATAAYTTLTLVVDAATGAVNESILVDSSGNSNQFTFSNQDYATPIKKSVFKVNPKSKALKGYRLVP